MRQVAGLESSRIPSDERVIDKETNAYRERNYAERSRNHRVRLLTPNQDESHDIADCTGNQQNP